MCMRGSTAGNMPKAPETSEERLAGEVSLPSWAKDWNREHGEKPLPLREAARLAGLGLTKAKEIVAAKPRLVRFRRASTAGGRPAPHVMPSELREAASYGKKSTASARFAHRCRLAGVNPSETLWRIVTGCLPDADKLIDAMQFAFDDEAGGTHNGNPLFLCLVGGSVPLPSEPRMFVDWLARFISRRSEGKATPRGSYEALWRKALRKVEKEGKLMRRLSDECRDGEWRLAERPEYWDYVGRREEGKGLIRTLAPYSSTRDRLLDRERKQSRKGSHALGEFVWKGGGHSWEADLAGLVRKLMRKAKASPRYPAFTDYLRTLGADSNAEQALSLLVHQVKMTRAQAMAYLGAYWWRARHPLNSKLSASAVREIFGMTTRARTGKRPERRRKSRPAGRKRNVSRSRLLSEKPGKSRR